MTENSLPNEERLDENEKLTASFYLYISPLRLIVMSILTVGIYQSYWIYKNWWYIKQRKDLDIKPFWRGIFGVFYLHGLLKIIKTDAVAYDLEEPTFSVNWLATTWVVIMIFGNLIVKIFDNPALNIIVVLFPAYLLLIPVQNYINRITKAIDPEIKYYYFSAGHVICLIIGAIAWLGYISAL